MSSRVGGKTLKELTSSPYPRRRPVEPISKNEYEQRIEYARSLLRQQKYDALLVTAGTSLRYFSGIPWRASDRLVAMMITLKGDPFVFCPAFESGSLERVLRVKAVVRWWEEDENPQELIARELVGCQTRIMALDPAAAVAVLMRLRIAAPNCQIVDAGNIINRCRMAKSEAELSLMQRASDITLEVHKRVAGLVHEGIATGELKKFIDEAHRAQGADGGYTFCIVLFGEATSYPHGIPGAQHLAANDLILVDTGCSVEGYNSDITRCYSFGRPDPKHVRIWELEHAAQAAAFEAVRPGVTCQAVDQAARKVIEDAGLGPGYCLPGLPHRTGHGCGMDVHEAPYLVRGDRTELRPGMCCSDEPMIVVPGKFGIRLEDHFYVTPTGGAWFTSPSPAIDEPFF